MSGDVIRSIRDEAMQAAWRHRRLADTRHSWEAEKLRNIKLTKEAVRTARKANRVLVNYIRLTSASVSPKSAVFLSGPQLPQCPQSAAMKLVGRNLEV